jgi:hypothetical protein
MDVLRSAAESKTREVQESKQTAEILVEQVNVEKAIAEEELSAAKLILNEAEEAVKVINIVLVRSCIDNQQEFKCEERIVYRVMSIVDYQYMSCSHQQLPCRFDSVFKLKQDVQLNRENSHSFFEVKNKMNLGVIDM